MDQISTFLFSRLSEDEDRARVEFDRTQSGSQSAVAAGSSGVFTPSRVLAECDAKRRIVREWSDKRDTWMAMFDRSDDELHQDWMHPAYTYATVTTARKSRDPDTPEGDGWERNITAKDDRGWEVFDYSEDSYWRRLRPDGPEELASLYPPPYALKCLALIYRDHVDYLQEWALGSVDPG